jgi:hypothetical protein
MLAEQLPMVRETAPVAVLYSLGRAPARVKPPSTGRRRQPKDESGWQRRGRCRPPAPQSTKSKIKKHYERTHDVIENKGMAFFDPTMSLKMHDLPHFAKIFMKNIDLALQLKSRLVSRAAKSLAEQAGKPGSRTKGTKLRKGRRVLSFCEDRRGSVGLSFGGVKAEIVNIRDYSRLRLI